MTRKDDGASVTESARERFKRTLNDRAQAIKCVRNDVFTVKYWQLALNFVLSASAVVLLVVSLTGAGVTAIACLIASLAAVIVTVVFNVALRAISPMSFLQYTAVEKDRRYCFQILGKRRSLFYDGETAVEFDRSEYVKSDAALFPRYRFDFFKDMEPDVRIGKADREIYKGRLTEGGKTYKCKIVFKDGVPYVGTVGGARIKYFDVNSTKEKFVVPDGLRNAADAFGVPFPKLAGVHVIDSHADMMKQ